MSSLTRCKQAGRIGWVAAAIVAIGAGTASADTRIMPTRQALLNTAVVVWGNTDQANGTAFTLDCGNGVVDLRHRCGPVVHSAQLHLREREAASPQL